MWIFNYLPGIPSFEMFLFLECLVSGLFIFWCFFDKDGYQ